MSLLLLRHGQTAGNALGRYIGKTDEGLSPAGRAQVKALKAPPVQRVYASPLGRCLETARLLYPLLPPVAVEGLRECDFGDFENKSCRDLQGDPRYQRWIDSGGTLPFPGGESRAAFIRRTVDAFLALDLRGDVAVIAHGGTWMAVLSSLAAPRGDYFDYQVPCAGGFLCRWDGKHLVDVRRMEA